MPERLYQEYASILAVGLADVGRDEGPHVCTPHICTPGIYTVAGSARAAIELMRMLRFDLVLTSDRLPDMSVWQFVRRIRGAWPWQKWLLVSDCLTAQDEIAARTLGVMQIMEGAIDWEAVESLAEALHERSGNRRRVATASV